MGAIVTKLARQNASNDFMLVDDPRSATPPLLEVQDALMASTDDNTGFEAFYEILPDGSRRSGGGHREKQCTTCNKWIDLGEAETGETALTNHEGKRRCLATVHNNKLEEERHASAAALDDLRQTASLSPRTPYRPKQVQSLQYSPFSSLSFARSSQT